MNVHETELQLDVNGDGSSLEGAVKTLSDKVRRVGELLIQLRGEKQSLLRRVEELEKETAGLRADIENRELNFRQLKAEYTQRLNSNNDNPLTREEKEILKNRIRDLIAKINSHL